MKKKLQVISFIYLITALCAAENGQDISNESQIDEPLWEVFGEQETLISKQQPRTQTIDFSNPPKPSRLEVLMRRIGIPIFLRYIQFYNWVRRCVYWVRTRVTRAFSPLKRSNHNEPQQQ